jgi:hypothetical protein
LWFISFCYEQDEGFLKGTPKVLNTSQLNYSFISSQDGYFIRVEILRVGKFRQFTLLSKRIESGVRMFSNDIVGETVYIDKTALEDAITFQEIEFEILDGYYFNEGHNNAINNTIRRLYSKRKIDDRRLHRTG